MTGRDKINQMSNKELIKILVKSGICPVDLDLKEKCVLHSYACTKCWKLILESEVK